MNQIQPIVKIVDNKPVTSSVDVAEYFGKRHDNVIQKIQILFSKEPDYCLLNFKETSNLVPQPKGGTREEKSYLMTRAGFSLVVLGFTGDKALKFQIAYVSRFEEMETQLYGKPLQLDAPATKEQRAPLVNLVNALISVAPLSYRDAWHMVHATCNGKTAKELTFAEVCSLNLLPRGGFARPSLFVDICKFIGYTSLKPVDKRRKWTVRLRAELVSPPFGVRGFIFNLPRKLSKRRLFAFLVNFS